MLITNITQTFIKRCQQYHGGNIYRGLSFHEMYLVTFPYSMSAALVCCLTIFVNTTDATYALSAVLPPGWNSCKCVIVVSVTTEFILLCQISAAHFLCSYVMLGYALPHMVHGILDCVDVRLKTEAVTQQNLSSICNDLVLASLEIRYYNHTYAPTNYAVKLLCMFIPITGLFVGIRHWHVSLGLSISMVWLGINTTVLFMTYLGHAYEVPEKVQQLKLTILEKSSTLPKNQRNHLHRVVLRIPACGIRAGRFYTSDRSTIPVFIDFVIVQVCGLLVAF
ncbi:unnamed protein product [Allacma fusca]|uniref:Uncharacterized protein n=1 Tax=Allacma fusca TaxID=39272 RepID=A0A8J2J1I9_9HEXA|nr:unnamed protein product [Allacma fusca]